MNENKLTLGFLLERSWFMTIDALNKALAEADINLQHSQYIIVKLLYETDGLCQRDIAMRLHRDAAGVKRNIDLLEKCGFVERRALSGSKNGVYLTDKALELKPIINAIANAVTETVCADMSPEMYHNGMAFLCHLYNTSKQE